MIETMAQCSGILIMHTIDFTKIPLLAGVKEGKLRDFVGPKTELEIKAEIEHEGSGFAVTRAEIRSGGKRVANAQLTFHHHAFPEPGTANPDQGAGRGHEKGYLCLIFRVFAPAMNATNIEAHPPYLGCFSDGILVVEH